MDTQKFFRMNDVTWEQKRRYYYHSKLKKLGCDIRAGKRIILIPEGTTTPLNWKKIYYYLRKLYPFNYSYELILDYESKERTE